MPHSKAGRKRERHDDEGATEPVITPTLHAYGIPDTGGINIRQGKNLEIYKYL